MSGMNATLAVLWWSECEATRLQIRLHLNGIERYVTELNGTTALNKIKDLVRKCLISLGAFGSL